MKLLGEGAFARVELCRLKESALQRLTDTTGGAAGALPAAQGRALLRNKGRVAVKCMKRFVEQETASGAIRQVPTPQQWFADFDAEALLLQACAATRRVDAGRRARARTTRPGATTLTAPSAPGAASQSITARPRADTRGALCRELLTLLIILILIVITISVCVRLVCSSGREIGKVRCLRRRRHI